MEESGRGREKKSRVDFRRREEVEAQKKIRRVKAAFGQHEVTGLALVQYSLGHSLVYSQAILQAILQLVIILPLI